MHGEKGKGYTYKPVWQILAIAAVLSAVLIFLGVKGWQDIVQPDRGLTAWGCLILAVIAVKWKRVHICEDHILTVRLSLFKKKVDWEDIERVELVNYYTKHGRRAYLLIEKKGCPPCPDLCRMIVGEWYLLRHRRNLIPVDLEGPNIEEGVAAMNAYYPISHTAEWKRFSLIKL